MPESNLFLILFLFLPSLLEFVLYMWLPENSVFNLFFLMLCSLFGFHCWPLLSWFFLTKSLREYSRLPFSTTPKGCRGEFIQPGKTRFDHILLNPSTLNTWSLHCSRAFFSWLLCCYSYRVSLLCCFCWLYFPQCFLGRLQRGSKHRTPSG